MFKDVMNDLWLARISSLSNEVGLYVVLLEVLLFMPLSVNLNYAKSLYYWVVIATYICGMIPRISTFKRINRRLSFSLKLRGSYFVYLMQENMPFMKLNLIDYNG